jgi:thiamine biosynthesis lipoprotein
MGTMARLVVYAAPDSAEAILNAAERVVHDLDARLTAFDEDAALGLLNRRGRESLEDPHLRAMLEAADSLASMTAGAYDPTAGGLVTLWGFPHAPAVPESSALDSALARTGWGERVRLTSDSVFLDEGVRLDFGAAAKGYAADCGYGAAMDAGATAALLEVGGEVRCGSAAGFGREWTVGIRHPRGDGLIDTVRLRSGAVATSGDYECFFLSPSGRRLCHIIDPATGWPARGAASATVLADRCVVADAVATALVIGGEVLADSLPAGLVRAILLVRVKDGAAETRRWGEWRASRSG